MHVPTYSTASAPIASLAHAATSALREARRIVVKVGSSLVTNEGRGLDEGAIGEWCRQLAALHKEGVEVINATRKTVLTAFKQQELESIC